MPESIPSRIGRYVISHEVGRGGFGRVYRGLDPTVGRLVAVKILNHAGQSDLTRFRNEAAVAGNLRHKNIVTIYEFGEHEGKPFLAMEYLEGEDLHHIITSHKPLSALEKCSIMSQVAEGLHCAHQSKVVHRDVKPANIMVLRDGTVKIMDFGIARITKDRNATRLTEQGSLIGTLLYMAPEQLSGVEVDELCDIFAFGEIYYELLTGKHPFEAPDSRAMMFKVSFLEPPPITDHVPSLPEALQRVVAKAMHKDRDMRYQNLQALLFDTEPILIDLRKERAASLLSQAHQLFEKEQLDPALTAVLEVLRLDASNTSARDLWETLQKRLQQRTLQPRIEALLRSGEAHLQQVQFLDAVQSFEAALRLDRDSEYIQGRLQHARAQLEHARKAASLLQQARREFERQNLTAAQRIISDALSHDPQNQEAAKLLEAVGVEVERRRQQQRVEDCIRKAEALLLLHSYDEAIALLTALGPEAQTPTVDQLLTWIRKEQSSQQRKQRMHVEMARASDLLRDDSFEAATDCLLTLQAEFPDNHEVSDLLAYARRELEAKQRAKAIENIAAKAMALSEAAQFDAALETLDRGLKEFPGESGLLRLLAGTRSAKEAWDRQVAIELTIRQCEGLRSEKRFADAVDILDAAVRDCGDDAALLNLLVEVEKEWAEVRKREALRQAADRATKMLDQNQPAEAVQLIQQSLSLYPGEAALTDLMARARAQVMAQSKARFIEAAVQKASAHLEAREFDLGLTILDEALESCPADAGLLNHRQKVVDAQRAWERQHNINQAIERVRQLEKENQFGEALERASAARHQFPDSDALIQLEREVVQARDDHERREAILTATRDARHLISKGSLQEAIELLDRTTSRYPGDRNLDALAEEARNELRARERAAAIRALVEASERLLANREFDHAGEVVQHGLNSYPGEPELLTQFESVMTARARWLHQQAIQRVVADAEQLADQNRFEEGLQLLAGALKSEGALGSDNDEPALLNARRRLEARGQEYKRQLAVSTAAEDVKRLLGEGRLDEAVQLLTQLQSRYPGEGAWGPLGARAQEELRARQRADAITKAIKEARALARASDFSGALQILRGALDAWPGDSSLSEARRAIENDKSAWERDQAIQEAIQGARRLTRENQYDQALSVVATSLQQYPGESALLRLQQMLKRDWEQRQRVEAVSRAVNGAQAAMQSGRFEEAAAMLREACAHYPEEAHLTSLLSQVEDHIRARQRQERLARESENLYREGRYAELIALLEGPVKEFPGNSELASRLSAASEQLELSRRAEAIRNCIAASTELADRQNFASALAELDRGLEKWPGEESLVGLRKSTLAAKSAWDRERQRRNKVEQVEALRRDKRFGEALNLTQAALREYPEEPMLLQLQREIATWKGVEDATALMDQHRPAEALPILEALRSGPIAQSEIAALMDRATAAIRESERIAAIEEKANAARSMVRAGDISGALGVLDEGLRQWPAEADLLEIRRVALEAKAERERQLAIQTACLLCEREEREGPEIALELVDRYLAEFGNEPRLLELQQRLQHQIAEEQRRRNCERDLAELRELDRSAEVASEFSEISELLERAQRIVNRWGDAEIASAAAEPIQALSDMVLARRELVDRQFDSVLKLCETYLREHPRYLAFDDLKQKAKRARQLADLEDLQRRVAIEGSLEDRMRMLDEGLRRYPDDPWIAGELRITGNKLGLVNAIVKKAHAAQDAGNWEEALEEWKRLVTVYPQYPGVDAEIQRVQRAAESWRTERIAYWVRQIEPEFESGDLRKAEQILRQAQTELPAAPALEEASRRLKEIRKRRKLARELLTQAEAALDRGADEDARSKMRQALELESSDASLRERAVAKLMEQAGRVVESDWRRAESLLAECAFLQPDIAPPEKLTASVARSKAEEIVTQALQESDQLRDAGNLTGALARVEQALAGYPREPRLQESRAALAARIQEQLDALMNELHRMPDEVAAMSEPAQVEPLRARASAIASESPDGALNALALDTIAVLDNRIRELKRAQTRRFLAANRNRLLAVAAGVIVIVATGVLISRRGSAIREINVRITSDVPGVAIAAGNQRCVTPDCVLQLPPGDYTLSAQKDGYASVTQPLRVNQGASALALPLSIAPLPQLLQVNTNFESGKVFLDGRSAGDLRDGQFSLADVPLGQHTIRVSDGDVEFQAQWKTVAGAPPELTGPIAAKEVQATIVSNAGKTGTIFCNCGKQDVTVDGTPSGQTSSTANTPLKALAPGPRQIAIGGHPLVVDVRPNPTLYISLSLDRDVGTLVIEAGVDNPRIFIDNRLYGRTTEHGILRVQLPSGRYSIRVERDGFRRAAPQTVEVSKGEEKQLPFALTPLPAVLEIAGALPGARIAVDSKTVGVTNAAGSFSGELDVAAGNHTVELSKDDYTPARFPAQFSPGKTTRPDRSRNAMARVVRTAPAAPTGAPSADQVEVQDWTRTASSSNPDDFDDFLRKHPTSAHADEARNRAGQLRQAQATAAARQAEQAAWDAVDKSKTAALQDFLSRYGAGPHAQEARNQIGAIQKQGADALASQRTQEEQRKKAAEAGGIVQTLADFERAYNQKNLAELQRIWRDIPAKIIEAQFRDAKTLSYQLRPGEPPVIAGDTAIANCVRKLSFTSKDLGRPFSKEERVHVNLGRTASGWEIRSIVPY